MIDQPSPTSAVTPARRRLVVVSGFGDDALTPRGQRTQQEIRVLSRDWEVELIAMPARDHRGGGGATGRSIPRRLASRAVQELLFDRWEPWARQRFGRWRPEADAAVLVVAPWSPAAVASRRLRERGIPYVIDAGDPWAVGLRNRPRTIAGRRSLRAEAPIWEGAAGAILTTPQQAQRMSSIYPELPIMFRPNGYEIPDGAPRPDAGEGEPGGSRLRLAHFGVVYAARLDVVPFLTRLQQSGNWDSVRFDQFGGDPDGMLNAAPPGVEVANHAAIPWPEVMARTDEFDAVVVLGNELGELLPSKAVQYLTLPVPRIAVTDTERDDALTDFARGHSAWLAVSPTDPEAGRLVAGHVNRDWTAAELDPPPADRWPAVAEELGAFVSQCVAGRSPDRLTPAR
jgi:hypothetical protein